MSARAGWLKPDTFLDENSERFQTVPKKVSRALADANILTQMDATIDELMPVQTSQPPSFGS